MKFSAIKKFFASAGKGGDDAPSVVSNRRASSSAIACDWVLFVVAIVLLAFGLVMVLSASGIVAEQNYSDKYYFFKRQLLFALIGGVFLCISLLLPRKIIYKLQYPSLFICLFLLLLTLSPLSHEVNGAKRWLIIGPFSFQPMEFVKISLALYLAYFMSSKQNLVKTFSRGVIPPFAVTGLFCLLLLLEPDYGSAVVLIGILFFMCIAGGTRFIYLFIALAIVVALALTLAIASPYRLRRLLAFLDPFQDAHNAGYQLVQSLLAFGSGGFLGVGVGASKQKMFYLPEAHNDFIMAVLAEEIGFVGVAIVMILFALLFYRCYKIIMSQEDLRDRFSAFGITSILAMGYAMNLAVVMGIAPPKGVPMPFLSYGGSNLLATMICVGLLMNFSRKAVKCTESAEYS